MRCEVCQEVGELSSVWYECEYECEFEMRRDEMNELVRYEVWKQEEKLRRIWL